MTQSNRQRPNDARQVRASLWLTPSSEEAGEWATNFRDGADADHDNAADDFARLLRFMAACRASDIHDGGYYADRFAAFIHGDFVTLQAAFGLKKDIRHLQRKLRRDEIIVEAAATFCSEIASKRGQAELLSKKLSRYRATAWQRDQFCIACPQRHARNLQALLWEILKLEDAQLSWESIRKVLG